MPILGIVASSKAKSSPGWNSIVSLSMTGDTPVTISSIPQSYTDLRIVTKIKGSTVPFPSAGVQLQMNGDSTAANYQLTVYNIFGSSMGTASSATIPYVSMLMSSTAANSAPGIVEIFDYANPNKFKTMNILTGFDVNSSMYNTTYLNSGRWLNNAAITSITFNALASTMVGTISLYGLKAAS
jgi:hypothetical protein